MYRIRRKPKADAATTDVIEPMRLVIAYDDSGCVVFGGPGATYALFLQSAYRDRNDVRVCVHELQRRCAKALI